MGKRFRRRGRTDEEIIKGREEQARREDIIARRKERAALCVAIEKGQPGHEELTGARKRTLQRALQTPSSVPMSPLEIVADRERRENAMLEVDGQLRVRSPSPDSQTTYTEPVERKDRKRLAVPGSKRKPEESIEESDADLTRLGLKRAKRRRFFTAEKVKTATEVLERQLNKCKHENGQECKCPSNLKLRKSRQ